MKTIPFLCCFVIMMVIVGCSGSTFVSSWNNGEITIDGSRQEWGEQIHYLEDEKIAFSVKNDENFFYLFIATAERERIMQIMSTGLTVWFDPQNSDGKTFGIQHTAGILSGSKTCSDYHP